MVLTKQALGTTTTSQSETSVKTDSTLHQGLSDPIQKWISPMYFYDEAGSKIYEEITELDEYYPTRTEAALLKTITPWIETNITPEEIVELGSGSSTKTRIIFDSWNYINHPLRYVPIDISETMLAETVKQLKQEYKKLDVVAFAGKFEEALTHLWPLSNRLVLFLGSTIGNFSPEEQLKFFSLLYDKLTPENYLLVGFDLQAHTHKPVSVIHNAYNDAEGVTARFNLNMLSHLNTAYGADFKLADWAPYACYNEDKHQIEMYLESLENQAVSFSTGEEYYFKQGEKILTEISRKYDPTELANWFEALGFKSIKQWTDEKQYFGVLLLQK